MASSPEQAREAAVCHARGNLVKSLVREAVGLGADSRALEAVGLVGVEIIPDCFHVTPAREGFDAWVQVSYPLKERAIVIRKLEQGGILNGKWVEARAFAEAGKWAQARDAAQTILRGYTNAVGTTFTVLQAQQLIADVDRHEAEGKLNAIWNEVRVLRDRGEAARAVPLLEQAIAQSGPELRLAFEPGEARLMLADLWIDQKKTIRGRRIYEELASSDVAARWKNEAGRRLASLPPMPRMGPLNDRWAGRKAGLLCVIQDGGSPRRFADLTTLLGRDCAEAELESIDLSTQFDAGQMTPVFEREDVEALARAAQLSGAGVVVAVLYQIDPGKRNKTEEHFGVAMPVHDARIRFLVQDASTGQVVYRGQFTEPSDGRSEPALARYAASILITKHLVPRCPALK